MNFWRRLWQWVLHPHDDRETTDVRTMMQKFGIMHFDQPGHLTTRKALERVRFLKEELEELEDAMLNHDLAEQVDALVDLVYVAKGTALMLGVDWSAHWDEVQRANLAKVRGVGKRGNKVDLVKPPGWVSPQHDDLLRRQGYDAADWLDDDTLLREEVGRDDHHS